MDERQFGQLLMQIQSEYLERPELRLTEADVQQRWSADVETCQAALDLLVDASVLRRAGDGAFVRFEIDGNRADASIFRVRSLEFHSLASLSGPRGRRNAPHLQALQRVLAPRLRV